MCQKSYQEVEMDWEFPDPMRQLRHVGITIAESEIGVGILRSNVTSAAHFEQ